MRKFLVALAACAACFGAAEAGGYLTNTNQSINFLRQPARDGAIGVDGAYYNPAGVGFLANGWHLGFNLQSAYQSRTTTATFGQVAPLPFALGTVNGRPNAASGLKRFDGKAQAPVLPSISLVRTGNRWFASFHFGITGGGGKCHFTDGLPSFESQVAMLPTLISAIAPGAVNGYSFTTSMRGRQYYFGGQFGAGYKLTPKLNVSVGGRVVYADCNYYGYVRNISVSVPTAAGNVSVPATTFFEQNHLPHFAGLVADKELNADQSGWGFTPIVGLDYKTGRWNFSAKYEFKTRLRLNNRSGVNTSGLEEFDDGRSIAADIPAILTLGAQYEPLDGLRLNGGFHYYFDRQATQHNHREEHLAHGGWEVLAGAEYDISRRWTVSAGWQSTNYGLGSDSRFLSDMSFVTNSNSVGLGAAFRLKERVRLNVAYFKTFYRHYRKNQADYGDLRGTFTSMLTPMAGQLQAAAGQLQAVLKDPQASATDKAVAMQQLSIVAGEGEALKKVAGGLQNYSTAGFDNFHRTNDVFGIGLEIDF